MFLRVYPIVKQCMTLLHVLLVLFRGVKAETCKDSFTCHTSDSSTAESRSESLGLCPSTGCSRSRRSRGDCGNDRTRSISISSEHGQQCFQRWSLVLEIQPCETTVSGQPWGERWDPSGLCSPPWCYYCCRLLVSTAYVSLVFFCLKHTFHKSPIDNVSVTNSHFISLCLKVF